MIIEFESNRSPFCKIHDVYSDHIRLTAPLPGQAGHAAFFVPPLERLGSPSRKT